MSPSSGFLPGFLAVAVAGAVAEPQPSELETCRMEGLTEPARCGIFELPENPDEPQGRKLAIHAVVIPATGDAATKDPIVPLMGGPGENAISAAAEFVSRSPRLPFKTLPAEP